VWLNSGLRKHGLAALAAFLKRTDRNSVFADPKNFVDPVLQARADLDRFERTTERIWEVALRELHNLKLIDSYRAAQIAGVKRRTTNEDFHSGEFINRGSFRAGMIDQGTLPHVGQTARKQPLPATFPAKKLRFSALSYGFKSLLLHQNFTFLSA
jgi:hypothetical protein